MALEVAVLGVGAGSTCTYYREASSSFVLCVDGKPLLMLDVGLGSVAAALQTVGHLPEHIYVSHNHTDHAGELPVLLAVEAASGHRKTVLAEASVLDTLQTHRLAELRSTGKPLSSFADFVPCSEGQLQKTPSGLALQPLRSRHAETCYGALIYWQGKPVLGWTADSGYDEGLYCKLAAAPVMLLDGRAGASSEHASFEQLQAAVDAGVFGHAQCCVYGYGRLANAPASSSYPGFQVLKPGDRVHLQRSHGQRDGLLNTAATDSSAACSPCTTDRQPGKGASPVAVNSSGSEVNGGDQGSSATAECAIVDLQPV